MDGSRKNIYNSLLNGRVPNDGTKINGIEEITYNNPATKKRQTQRYLDMDDIIIPFILRKNPEGKYQFGMEYKYIPASGKKMLELPVISTMKNINRYEDEEIQNLLDERLLSNYDLDMIGYKYLDSACTPVSQSFTNQKAICVLSYIDYEENGNNNLEWFDISSLQDYLFNYVGLSSLQTAYVMQLFYEQYKNKEELRRMPTNFQLNEVKINGSEQFEKQYTIMENEKRFGVDFLSNRERKPEDAPDAEVGLSGNSIQCVMIRNIAGKKYIGLMKQLRSPFIATENYEENLDEVVAGMVEPGETYQETVRREVKEETGIDISKVNLSCLGTQLLSTATQEESVFYICELPEEITIGEQRLDDEEIISNIIWFPMDEIDLAKLHGPLATKYAILKAKEYFKIIEENDIEKPEDLEK